MIEGGTGWPAPLFWVRQPFVLGPAALCSGSGSAFFCIYLSRTSICRILCHGRGVLYLCGPFDLTTVLAI